jgi:hypothetical protein
MLALAFLIVAPASAAASDTEWRPIDPAHLALKASAIEKDADAEVIFWEVLVDLGSNHTTLSNYIRIKIFTERGKESQSKIDLPYAGRQKVEDVAARTIRPDGTVVEMNKDAVNERTVVKIGGVKLKAKSFVLPAVEPGAMIEYRWRESLDDELFLRLAVQRDVPIRTVKYYLKASSSLYSRLRTRAFNGRNTEFVREKDNLYSMTMTDVPAFHEEPDMPPEDQVRSWILVYFLPDLLGDLIARASYDAFKSSTRLNDDLRKSAATIIGDAATSGQKIQRLFEFCRAKIKNVDREAGGLADADRAKLKEQKTAADTLKRGAGTGQNINMLFAALAIAAGFDARLALVCDRGNIFFDPRSADPLIRLYFMKSNNIAVNVDKEWQFFDPGSAYVPYGMLRWQEEAQHALLIGTSLEEFKLTPLSPPEKSLQKRTARLRLSEDGTLEGDVEAEYSGHFAVEKKLYSEEDSPAERERTLREQVKARMSAAELSDVKIENVTDPAKPFVYAYHVRVPGYAQRTGKRLFLQPAFFQKGLLPRFAASERRHGIYFHYPWSEEDNVSIELPAGFELDNAESVGAVPLANVGKYDVNIGVTRDKRLLVYTRHFIFGLNGAMLFKAESYGQLKRIYDTMHELDNHTITLKQSITRQTN